MVIAAIKANAGGGTFPVLKCIALDSAETGFGTALTVAKQTKHEFIVSPYDGQDSTLRTEVKDHAQTVSGAQRVENNQFGTIGVVFNRSVTDPSTLDAPDTQYLTAIWMRDTGTGPDAPAYSIGEMAAASAARIAAGAIPFNPLDNVTIGGVAAPALLSDYITVGAGLESESCLNRGWTPLRVKPNGEVSFVRTTTTRITTDGVVAATSYYDVQDFQVLYFWRKTVFTRLNQPDLKQVKASQGTASLIKGELLRLAQAFEDQNMFQAVSRLAPQFVVERSASDRHRFDVKTPVNVIPGLHVVAVNVVATTEFDSFSI
ncbi:MAG: hypothetical protein HC842_07135 [Cytophagales bacterium]|nr:hypothetical protein [Cytophagales bacterium]